MAKFHIKLKLQGLELEVDGTRDDLPVIREALTQQFAGLMAPATDIADGEVSVPPQAIGAGATAAASVGQNGKRPRRKRSTASSTSTATSEAAVDWRHDTSKYGSPKQGWSTAQKSIWLLYVVASEANLSELTAKCIELTFNKHFRPAGAIRAANIIRDLGKLKVGNNGEPPQIGQDTSKDPSTWYLNESGTKAAQKLVADALGQTV